MSQRFLIMAGGTGGHVFPALATAEALREKGHEVAWLGSSGGMEADLIGGRDIPLYLIEVSGLRGKGGLTRLAAPVKLVRALWQAVAVIRRFRPDCVLGMGGFAAGPGGLAAWLLRRPLVIHEQNAVAGMTNQWLSHLAEVTLEAFPGAYGSRTVTRCTGNPVRQDLTGLPAPAERIGRGQRLKLLVLGGSRGARAINEVVPEALASLATGEQPEVRHQCGRDHLDSTRKAYADAGLSADVVPFIGDMAEAYGWADLVVCRAGALTLAELACVGVGSVLVPFPHAVDDHQTVNARHLSDAGAALLMPQSQLDAAGLAREIQRLDDDRDALRTMAERARELAVPDATERVVNYCLEAAHGRA
ncbi:undecaprenyldiphospho-muramoylpentapeptide beta-N-acetylglucosaminyltransferase [Halospina sp. K52047b]|uniref:undecaprenyldiphospho-muramoylpentapeptide beta-N-acetylglucosaminyltransferase n=1 Tax=Halospina sp. K52047b TaxID=2614160 RepID=UPI00124A3968|nr:undecaprenyldiphospho-muramoylpentapeptide beta-N-acetylglucosaminyltransferase [Halospina sp. K52047b]KAA8980683.1 undecaprenyldiphospho-muramoylpentapeptide beta-N-acetylglucosaminyltransferase [Halospina sp. K52047b]